MRRIILFLMVCCLAGCATQHQQPPPVAVAEAPNPPPDIDKPMTPEQITELKHRLDRLQAGMSRDKVLEILDMPSLNVRYYTTSRASKIAYHIKLGHTLTLSFNVGDYDSTLRSAWFDAGFWPKDNPPPKRQPVPGAP